MSTVEVLVRARALYARAPSHAPVEETPHFGSYCMVTAVYGGNPRNHNVVGPLVEAALREAVGAGPTISLVDWNAEHTTEEVLAVFDRAIATERERCRTTNDLDGIPVREPARTLSVPAVA